MAIDVTTAQDRTQAIVDLARRLVAPSVNRWLLVHAFDVPLEGRVRSVLTHEELLAYRAAWKERAAGDLRRLEARLHLPGVRLETILRSGDPRTVILREAARRHADLIVLGTHGRSGIAHSLLGSVAAHLARFAACDVAIERPTSHRVEAP